MKFDQMYILSSKVTRPAPPSQFVDRPRLYARLDQWQTRPVVFVHAPAGYGKSMLVCRWLEVRGLASHAAWLSLDPGDDDPQQFVRYLAAALEPIVPGIAAAVHLVLDAPEQNPCARSKCCSVNSSVTQTRPTMPPCSWCSTICTRSIHPRWPR